MRTFETGAARTFVAVLLVFASAVAGCGLQRPYSAVRERFDEASGVTILTDKRPIVFARTEARYSRAARDYLYLGWVETNRQGSREYYLWVGVGTTLDRRYLGAAEPVPERLYADVGGEPMAFTLTRDSDLAALPELYRTAVPLRQVLAARVTLDQLAVLAAAPLASVRIAAGSAAAETYLRWDEPPSWPGFTRQPAQRQR